MSSGLRKFYESRDSLTAEEREKFDEIFEPIIREYGHGVIRAFYQLSHRLRLEFECNSLPITLLYRLSLFRMFETEYAALTTKEVIDIEGLPKRTAYQMKARFWKQKHDAKKLTKNG
jgi:hypothetical protein